MGYNISRDRAWFDDWLDKDTFRTQTLLTEEDIDDFKSAMETPVTLLRQCRQAVVWNFNIALQPALDTLPLPEPIKEYLSFTDIDHIIEHMSSVYSMTNER